jgi:predicted small secreted protein
MKTTKTFSDMTSSLTIITAAIAFGFGSLFLASCHTMHGVGEDVQEVGEEIEDQAAHHHHH